MYQYENKGKNQLEKSPIATKQNNTGISLQMKERIGNLSWFSFDDEKVHYNSDKPAQLQALAYTQGNQVYVAPRQEKHLGHGLGHVVIQKKEITEGNAIIIDKPTKITAKYRQSTGRLEEIGYLKYTVHDKEMWINSLFSQVSGEKYIGIGSRLMNRVAEIAIELDLKKIITASTAESALGFYQKLGFMPAEGYKDRYKGSPVIKEQKYNEAKIRYGRVLIKEELFGEAVYDYPEIDYFGYSGYEIEPNRLKVNTKGVRIKKASENICTIL